MTGRFDLAIYYFFLVVEYVFYNNAIVNSFGSLEMGDEIHIYMLYTLPNNEIMSALVVDGMGGDELWGGRWVGQFYVL